MRLAFDLSNGAIASYQWGDLHASFGAVSTPTTQVLKDTLAALSSGVARWRTPAEFRGSVSLIHEFAHYLQDISTGVGHWDYLQRQTYVREILGASRAASWLPGESPEVARLATAFVSALLFRPFNSVSDAQLAAIKQRFEDLIPGENITRELLGDFSIEALLESEAAATTFAQMTPLKMTDDAFAIFKNNFPVFELSLMGRVYSAPYRFVDDLLELPDSVRGVSAAGYITWVLSVLVDLACAYPSPGLLQQSPVGAADFHPSVKFARLMRAYHQIDAPGGADVIQALRTNDGALFERALLRQCPVPYPTREVIYQDWLTALRELEVDADSTIALRILACERRLANSAVASEKTLGALLVHGPGLPFFCRSPYGHGLGYVILGWSEGLDAAAVTRLTADMSRNARDLRLVELLSSGVPYVCPIAEQGICQAVQASCTAGINSLDLLPDTDSCLVRAALRDAGWRFN